MAENGSLEPPFFIYDHSVLQKEEDDIKDAIMYYYPPMTSIDERCALCGQLMGMVTFFTNMTGAPPLVYHLKRLKVALLQEGRFTIALASEERLPDRVLIDQLGFVYRLFTFYHRNIADVAKLCKKQGRNFVEYLGIIWDTYIPFTRYYGDEFLAAMRPVPTLQLPRGQSSLFVRASHLLEACQQVPGVLSGCLLAQNRVFCTQLTPALTSRLLLLRPHQTHLPCRAINTDFSLPVGVRLLAVYITEEEEMLLYSPWCEFETECDPEWTFSSGIDSCTSPESLKKCVNTTGETKESEEETLSFVSLDEIVPDLPQEGQPENLYDLPPNNTGKPTSPEFSQNVTESNKVTGGVTGSGEKSVHSGDYSLEKQGNKEEVGSLVNGQEIKNQLIEKLDSSTVNDLNAYAACLTKAVLTAVYLVLNSTVRTSKKSEEHLNKEKQQTFQFENRSNCLGHLQKLQTLYMDSKSTSMQTFANQIVLSVFDSAKRITSHREGMDESSMKKLSDKKNTEQNTDKNNLQNFRKEYSSVESFANQIVLSVLDDARSWLNSRPEFSKRKLPHNNLSEAENLVVCGENVSKGDMRNTTMERIADKMAVAIVEGVFLSMNNPEAGNSVSSTKLNDERHLYPSSDCYVEGFATEMSQAVFQNVMTRLSAKINSEGTEPKSDFALDVFAEELTQVVMNDVRHILKEANITSRETTIRNQDFKCLHIPCDKQSQYSESQCGIHLAEKMEEHLKHSSLASSIQMVQDVNCFTGSLHNDAGLSEVVKVSKDLVTQGAKITEDEHCTAKNTENENNAVKNKEDEHNAAKNTEDEHNANNSDIFVVVDSPESKHSVDNPQGSTQNIDVNHRTLPPQSPKTSSKDTVPLTLCFPASTTDLFKAVKQASKTAVQNYGAILSAGDSSEIKMPVPPQITTSRNSSGSTTRDTDLSQAVLPPPVSNPMKRIVDLTKPLVDLKQSHTQTKYNADTSGSLPEEDTETLNLKLDQQLNTFTFNDRSNPKQKSSEFQKDRPLKRRKRLRRGADGLREVDLYIQGSADMLLLLLMEGNTGQDKDTIHKLWKSALPQLEEMDLYLKQRNKETHKSTKKDLEYNYLRYSTNQETLKGNCLQPVTANELKFGETTITMHNDFRKSDTLSDIVLRSHNSYVYGHRAAGQETFFQVHGSARTMTGFPNERQLSMAADSVAYQKMLSEEQALII